MRGPYIGDDAEEQEPRTEVEWGVLTAGGELGAGMTERIARLSAEGRDDVTVVRRKVTYEPWIVAPSDRR